MRKAITVALLCGLAAFTLATAVWLFPFDCDAAFIGHDAIWYGLQAETSPAASLNPAHLLFHVAVNEFVAPLESLGVAHPGHVACRIVAGLAGVWLLLQIAALAGRKRLAAGALFALVVVVSRGFVVEAALGENVIPAAAAALFALTRCTRPNASLVVVTAALTLALLFRQDNLLIVPGVALAVASGRPPGTRLASAFKVVAWSGLLTLGGYLAGWMIATGGAGSFVDWLLGLAREGPFSGPPRLAWERFGLYATSAEAAMTGRLQPADAMNPLVGPLYLAAFLLAGLLLRGNAPRVRLAISFFPTLVARAFFHTWFEADNFEWLILPIALVAAFAAGLAHGEPATGPLSRRAGVALLLALAGWLLFAHGPSTWLLRERSFMESAETAAAVDRTRWQFIAASVRADQALTMLEIPHRRVKEGPAALDDVNRELAAVPSPTTILWDRGLVDGMPYAIRHREEFVMDVDTMAVPPGFERLSRDGKVYAVRWTPPAPSSGAASR